MENRTVSVRQMRFLMCNALRLPSQANRNRICTYVNVAGCVTSTEVVQDRSLVEVGQVSHVFNFLELWRIHLLNRILFNGFLLQTPCIFAIMSMRINNINVSFIIFNVYLVTSYVFH